MRSILNGQCYNVPLASKSYSKRYTLKEKLISARTQLETTSPKDDKYSVQLETCLLNLGKFLTRKSSPENITSEIRKYLQGL